MFLKVVKLGLSIGVFHRFYFRQLPNEAKLFSQVDKNWRDIMRRTIDRPNALAAATSACLLDVLQACNSNLEKIHRSLEVNYVLCHRSSTEKYNSGLKLDSIQKFDCDIRDDPFLLGKQVEQFPF